MFVGFSKFTVANSMEEQVRQAFIARPHRVDQEPGFVRMEVLQGADDPREFWLLTYWENAESFRAWHRSHAYKESHEGIPSGLKLVPGSARIRALSLVTE